MFRRKESQKIEEAEEKPEPQDEVAAHVAVEEKPKEAPKKATAKAKPAAKAKEPAPLANKPDAESASKIVQSRRAGVKINPYPSAPKTGAAIKHMSSLQKAKKINAAADQKTLNVGVDIHLKGEIGACDRLVIEGSVDANLSEVQDLEIEEGGLFKGTAEVLNCDISGKFDGEIIVQDMLVINSTAEVKGKIIYGDLTIESGAIINGTLTHISKAKKKTFKS